MGLIFKIAGRISAGRGGTASSSNLIATLSVAVSLFVVTLAIAITGGFKEEIRNKISGYCGDIQICARYADIKDWRTPIERLEFAELPEEIASISEVLYRNAILKSGGVIEGIVIKGMGEGYDTTFFASHLVAGRMPERGSDQIVISQRTASLLGISCGESVESVFLNEQSDAFGFGGYSSSSKGTNLQESWQGDDLTSDFLQARRLTVCGIYEARIEEMDKITAVADGELIREVNGWDSNTLSGYELRLKPLSYRKYIKALEHYSELFEEEGAGAFGIGEHTTALSAIPVNRSSEVLFNWLELLNLNVLIILLLMIAVASFNMVSGMLIMLFEKTSEIGILKSMGMSTRNISAIFLVKAAGTIMRGMALGGAAAIIFSLLEAKLRFLPLNPESYFTDAVPIHITLAEFVAILLLSFVAIMVVLLVPCHFIAKVSPAKSIKFN